MLRELAQEEISIISGGNANSNYEGGRCGRAAVKGGIAGAAGGAVANGLRGGVAGLAGGPVGVAAGALSGAGEGAVYGGISGAIGGYIGCRDRGSNNNGGAFGGDSNANSVNGQCHW
ncbi:hypothetical protein [Rahnella aceris]|jgi:hypothetical protein|uniref:hypothetical protein n=1 Tax=Rahnella sp. (strain Y9602) TaxID=2703885 RepID=UPI003BA1368A